MGELRITNTLTGEKEVFEPRDSDSEDSVVSLYVCGLTVSDDPHLGHARTWVSFDVLHRYLEHKGYEVRHVENITDIDDKIIDRAHDEDVPPSEVASRYSHQVYDDMKALNLRRVNVRPRVTQHIDDIAEMVGTLIEKGYAYESGGDVYFDVSEFEEYGKLSGQKLEELESQGEESGKKRDPADFALWKKSKEGEPSWESPWGEGRPGWHIECSAMSTTHLGETIDIHGGGRDLVFPHHENEIAQTEAATDHDFARYWMHVGPLRVEGEKMSTSLSNFWTVHDALDEYSANEIRAFLISTQYAKPQSFDDGSLEEGAKRWERIENAVRTCEKAMDSDAAKAKETDGSLRETASVAEERFEEAMDDDLNTPEALAVLFDLVNEVNAHVEDNEVYDYEGLFEAWRTLRELGEVLGFDFSDGRSKEGLSDSLIDLLLDLREEERQKGNYETADSIRDGLRDLGVEVEDTDEGTTYRY
ncbi:MAG: cysteine--tRNA ligase [Halobacteria archaeon]|nr:cysteine--tRNA ligase [Halobacteria archaeon]